MKLIKDTLTKKQVFPRMGIYSKTLPPKGFV